MSMKGHNDGAVHTRHTRHTRTKLMKYNEIKCKINTSSPVLMVVPK